METVTDTTQNDTVVEAAPETVTETPAVVEAAPVTFDPSKIDAQTRAYYEKENSTKYADHDTFKRSNQELTNIKNDPAFQKWIMERNAPAPRKPFELTDDQFTAALTDKTQFAKLVQEAAQHLVDEKIGPKIQQTEQHFQFEAKKNELAETVQKYPDFKDLDKRGLIEPLIRKYPNLSFTEAYKLAKFEDRTADIAKAARGQVTDRKGSNVERGNNAPSKSQEVVKVSDRLEAMTRAAEDFAAGRPAVQYDYD